MNKEFVPYDLALELKELDFNEPCFGYYEPNGDFNYIESNILKDFPYLAKNSEWKDLCGAPTFSQTFRWFRVKYGLYQTIDTYFDDNANLTGHVWYVYKNADDRIEHTLKMLDSSKIHQNESTYEESEIACLKELIKIVKNG